MMYTFRQWSRRTATAALIGLAALSQAQLLNPGFENGNGRFADNWFMFGNSYREPVGVRTGGFSMKLFGLFSGGTSVSGVFQDFAIAPGQTATSSIYGFNMATDAMSGDNFAILKLIYRDAANNDLVAQESGRITAGTPVDTWTLLTASLGPAPAGTHHGSVFLLFIQPDTTPFAGGAAFFDDSTLTVSSPMTTTGYTVTEGFEAGGDLNSLLSSDDNRLCIFNDDVTLVGQIEITGHTANVTPTSLTFTLEYQVFRNGLSVAVDLYRFSTNTWVPFAGGIAAIQNDQTLVSTVNNNVGNFTNANGDLKSRVTWAPINDEDPSQDGWLQCVDYAHWSM